MNNLSQELIECIESWLSTTSAYLQREMEDYSVAYEEAMEFDYPSSVEVSDIAEYINQSVLSTKHFNDAIIADWEQDSKTTN